jgi:membrane fusion protein, multidrug efflux system
MKRVIWAAAFVVIIAVGGLFYHTGLMQQARSQTPARAPIVPVRAATAAIIPTPVEFNTIGTVQTIASVAIKSRIDAVIDKVSVQDGQFVKTGDVMFQLDSRAAQAQVDQAAATLARDQAQLANAQHNVERDRPLLSKDFVSHQQFDTDSATAKALAATVEADQAALENVKVQLSYYTIVAPISGRVGAIAIKQGNSIKANDVPLATINQIQPIYVSFALPQSDLPELRQAMVAHPVTVTVVPQGDHGTPIEGKTAFFDNAIDTTSGTINVRAIFTNDSQRLWPGQSVNVSVLVRQDPTALVIPPTAVEVGQDGAYVFVIAKDNTVKARPVTVERTVAGRVVIGKGLQAGDKVVTDGQLRLVDGTHVQIISDTPSKPGDAS